MQVRCTADVNVLREISSYLECNLSKSPKIYPKKRVTSRIWIKAWQSGRSAAQLLTALLFRCSPCKTYHGNQSIKPVNDKIMLWIECGECAAFFLMVLPFFRPDYTKLQLLRGQLSWSATETTRIFAWTCSTLFSQSLHAYFNAAVLYDKILRAGPKKNGVMGRRRVAGFLWLNIRRDNCSNTAANHVYHIVIHHDGCTLRRHAWPLRIDAKDKAFCILHWENQY